MCGGCGKLLYLTGKGRFRRFFLLVLPVFWGVNMLGHSVLSRVYGLNIYREARGGYEPNFFGFLLICLMIWFTVSLLYRFEIVGVATSED